MRHLNTLTDNNVAGYIHWTICNRIWLEVTDKYYEHIPERVINVNGNVVCGMYRLSQIEQY